VKENKVNALQTRFQELKITALPVFLVVQTKLSTNQEQDVSKDHLSPVIASKGETFQDTNANNVDQMRLVIQTTQVDVSCKYHAQTTHTE